MTRPLRAMAPFLLILLLAGALAGQVASRHRSAEAGEPADWAATSNLLEGAGLRSTRVESTLLAVDGSRTDGLIVRANGVDLTPQEVDAVEAFANEGGRVLVLGEAALAARFDMEIARAPIHATSGNALRAEGLEAPLIPGARPLLGAGDPILSSERASFVDADGDARASAADVAGPFVVGRRALDGRVVVLSTPEIMENASLADEATHAYVRDFLVTHFPAGAHIALDATRAHDGAPLRDAMVAASIDAAHAAWLSIAVVALCAAAASAGWLAGRPDEASERLEERRVPLMERLP